MKNIWLYIIAFVLLLIFLFRKKMERFNLFMIIVFKHEGGYVNDPDDLGGETNFGITKRRYPNLDIKNLTKEKAKELYYKDFYIPMGIDKIKNPLLALHHFDMGINAGISNAKKILAEATLKAEKENISIDQAYKILRIEYYKKVATYRNNQKFLSGWLNRVNSTNIAV